MERLPEYIKPKRYDIFLDIDFKGKYYKGYEEITIDLLNNSNKIYLHSKEIKINKIKLSDKELSFRDIGNDIIEINLDKTYKGEIKLYIEFENKIREDLVGFYISSTNDKNRYIFTTQFEANYARMFIPCFDEPSFKAVFKIKVKIDKDLDAISNTLPEKIEEEKDKKIIIFKDTPKMSTYLLYLGIGKFYYLEDKYKDRVLLRFVSADKENLEKGKFALDWAKKVLEFYENYSEIEYPLEKLDLIAVKDFQAGAMENWGAITFREPGILYEEGKSSEETKYRILEYVAHELWHQWSGNLVTMKWWDDLWLNEAFATYMAYKAIEKLYDKNIWEIFVKNSQTAARSLIGTKIEDAIRNTHAIKVEGKIDSELLFDAITYEKGGNILRLLDNYMGEEDFRKAVSNYLKKYKYDNATMYDFLKELENIKGPEISMLALSWLKKKGYPIVEVNYQNKRINLKQERFLYKGSEKGKWFIPLFTQIKYKIDNNEKEENIIIKYNLSKGRIELKEDPKFFILNRDAITFSVFKYDKKLLEKIGNAIKNKEISNISRFGILNDMFLLSLANKIKISELLDFMKYYENEDNWMVLSLYTTILGSIKLYFGNINYKKLFENFKRPFERIYNDLLNKYDKLNNLYDIYKLYILFSYYSELEDKKIIDLGYYIFENYEKININYLLPIGLEIASTYGGYKEFNKIVDYLDSKDPEIVMYSTRYLANIRQESLLNKAFELLKDKIKLGNWRYFFPGLLLNPIAKNILYEWVKNNIELLEKYKDNKLVMNNVVATLLISNRDKRDEIKELFMKNRKLKELEYLVNKYYEISEMIDLWTKNNMNNLKEYIKNL